jgi:hypothetical protein
METPKHDAGMTQPEGRSTVNGVGKQRKQLQHFV